MKAKYNKVDKNWQIWNENGSWHSAKDNNGHFGILKFDSKHHAERWIKKNGI
jgi:hypothetical protein